MVDNQDIDYSDIPQTDADFWKSAKIVQKSSKKQVTIRLDEEIITFFKTKTPRYQTGINDVLRSYVHAHQK